MLLTCIIMKKKKILLCVKTHEYTTLLSQKDNTVFRTQPNLLICLFSQTFTIVSAKNNMDTKVTAFKSFMKNIKNKTFYVE